MGYLFHVLLALGCLALAPAGITTGWSAPWAILLLALVPYLLALRARRVVLAGRFRRASFLAGLLQLAPVPLFAVALTVTGWHATAEGLVGRPVDLEAWPHPGLFVALAPYFLFALLAIDARARAVDPRPEEVRRQRRFQARMLLASLAPVAVFVLVSWLVGWREDVRVQIEEVAVWSALFAATLLAVFVVLLPPLLRWSWDTEPLAPGPLRSHLEELARRARFGFRELVVWRTGGLVANAAIVGLWARQRVVILSDALLNILDPRELAAVFAHEMGHARHRHVLVFGAWTLAFLMAADLALMAAPTESEGLAALAMGAVLVTWFLVFGWLSRRYELEADLASYELTGDPGALATALSKVGGPHGGRRSSWRHFSVERRVSFLADVARDAAGGARLRRTLRALARVGAVLFLVLAGLELRQMAASWNDGRLVADLRLGRYASADARLAQMEEPGDDVRRIVERAAALAGPDGGASLESLEERALADLAAGHPQDARDTVELLLLRGWPHPEVATALESRELPAADTALDARWREALESWVGGS